MRLREGNELQVRVLVIGRVAKSVLHDNGPDVQLRDLRHTLPQLRRFIVRVQTAFAQGRGCQWLMAALVDRWVHATGCPEHGCAVEPAQRLLGRRHGEVADGRPIACVTA